MSTPAVPDELARDARSVRCLSFATCCAASRTLLGEFGLIRLEARLAELASSRCLSGYSTTCDCWIVLHVAVELILIVQEFRPVRGDARHVDEPDGRSAAPAWNTRLSPTSVYGERRDDDTVIHGAFRCLS